MNIMIHVDSSGEVSIVGLVSKRNWLRVVMCASDDSKGLFPRFILTVNCFLPTAIELRGPESKSS